MHGWHHIRLHATIATQKHNHENREKVSKKGSGEERAVERKSRGVLMSCMARSLVKERGGGIHLKRCACVRLARLVAAERGNDAPKTKTYVSYHFELQSGASGVPTKCPGRRWIASISPPLLLNDYEARTSHPCSGSSALKPSCVSRSCVSRSCVSRSYRQPTALQPYRPPAPCTRQTACPKPPTL